MNIKQNPFSLYDFLGYFVPGSFLLYSSLIVYGHYNQYSPPTDYVVELLNFNKTPELYIPFIILSYITGHFLSFLSSITIEKYSIWKFDYPSKYLLKLPHKGYLDVEEPKNLRIFIRRIVWVLIFPISFLDYVLGNKIRMQELYAKPLDDKLIRIIKRKVKCFLKHEAGVEEIDIDLKAKDFFRYLYHYSLENAPNHLFKMQNYVALYGFLRTISIIMVFFFWILLVHILYHLYMQTFSINLLILLLGSTVMAYTFFMAFVKFYRRFSLEAMMAVTVVYDIK